LCMPCRLLSPQDNNRRWTDECLPATTSTVLPLCGRNCNKAHATSLHCMERPFISSVLARHASLFRGPHLLLICPQQPNDGPRRLFRPSAATTPCVFPVPGDLIDSGVRQSLVSSPAIGSRSPWSCGSSCDGPARVWPPGVRRLVVGASASLHLCIFAPPAETRHSGSPLAMQLRWSARPWSSSPAADEAVWHACPHALEKSSIVRLRAKSFSDMPRYP